MTRSSDCKVFTFSGTPGKNKSEMLLQLELVRHASSRADHTKLLEETEGWEKRLAAYSHGLISYVDGTKDLSRYPTNCGVDKIYCDMSIEQLRNFSGRISRQLKEYGVEDIEELLGALREASGRAWKVAVLKARVVQAAATVFWGKFREGLRSELDLVPGPTSETLIRLAPKFDALVKFIINPPKTEPLQTKHYVYSSNQLTITALSQTFEFLRSGGDEDRLMFKQLFADDFEWTSTEERTLKLVKPLELDHPSQFIYIVLCGNVDEKKKLKSAFGQMTPDGTRYEGLSRPDGKPLIQLLIGTHECNQGLTFLRLQHIHLLEPNPKGWSEV
jgi:hypothetical protein